MPKRSCHFQDTFMPQLKVHIGEKHVDSGVMKEAKMKAVYDRTLNLLYSGAKNLMNNNAVEKMDATPNVQAKTSSHSTLHQMVLTNTGTLARPQPISQRLAAKPEATTSCITCRTVTSLIRPPCNYCECELCDSCARVCHFCGGSFCQKCSLTVYLQDEKTVCLSCC